MTAPTRRAALGAWTPPFPPLGGNRDGGLSIRLYCRTAMAFSAPATAWSQKSRTARACSSTGARNTRSVTSSRCTDGRRSCLPASPPCSSSACS